VAGADRGHHREVCRRRAARRARLGPIHGVLFLAYVGLALEVRRRLQWDGRTLLVVLAEAIVPGGGFVAARRRDLRG